MWPLTILLKQIFGLIKLLNSETGTNQIAWGIAAGFVLGMSPMLSLQTLLIIFLILIFRIQAGAAFLAAFFFKFVAYLLDPYFALAGALVLESSSLKGLFTTMYNMPLVPLTRFNNSIVMGSGLTAILLMPVIYIVSRMLIVKYRIAIVQRFQNTKFWKAVKATAFYKWYATYDSFYGA
jgi:uncharacterized protein (TIGR03546 family)